MNHPKFLIIDDDETNNMLCDYVISNALPEADVVAFTNPEQGIEQLQEEVKGLDEANPVSVLLDINMPTMSGWEVLEELQKMDPIQLKRFQVFMLSSSKDKRDVDKAAANPLVQDYFVKPLTKEMLGKILSHQGGA